MLRVDIFAGQVPGVAPRLIENNQATVAVNCLLTNGDCRSLESAAPIDPQPTIKSSAKTLYLYGSSFFSWDKLVNAVSSPVRQDPYDRVYFTGDGLPKYTRNDIALGAGVLPVVSYQLGIPKPDAPPTITYTPPATNDDVSDDNTRYYLCTFTSTMGEEGPPSDESEKVVIQDPLNDTPTINLPTLLNNASDVVYVNVYRSETGGDSAGYFKIKTLPIGTESWVDNAFDPGSVILATEGYNAPPSDMHSLVKLTGGMLVGASGQTVCPSEAYLPYAYKTANQQVANAKIVAMAALSTGAVVGTEKYPEILTGYAPEDVALTRLNLEQSCISARSMVSMDNMVIYASPDGLVMVNESQASLATDRIIEPEQWRALNPATIHAYQHEGLYIGFYDDVGGFIFDPRRPDIVFLDFYASSGFRDLKSDSLYLVINDQVTKWRTGDKLVKTWRSMEHKTPPDSYTYFRVKFAPGDDYSTDEVRVYTEGELHHSQLLDEGQDWGYLPPGLATSWHIEIVGTATVESVMLGDDLEGMGV